MRAPRPRDDGFTLVELLVSMALLVVVLGIFSASFLDLQRSVTKQGAVVDAQAATRKVFQLLDKQVRYANAVNDPGYSTLGTGDQYVEFQSGDQGAPQVCTQLRVERGTGLLQTRSWTVSSSGALVLAPAFSTVAAGLVLSSPVSVFVAPQPGPAKLRRLTVSLSVRDGGPTATTSGASTSTTTFTAANSTTPTAPSPAVCLGLSGGARP